MNEIEKQLEKERKRITQLKAPTEMEERLRQALKTANKPRRPFHIWKPLAAAAIIFLFAGYNFNALAYYGKQMFGFDHLLSGTLKNLNEAGKGQTIEKTIKLDEDTTLTIDGIMTDPNRMILYYTLSNPNGVNEYTQDLFNPDKITGLLNSSNIKGGMAEVSNNNTEIKGVMDFEPLSPFAHELTLHFSQNIKGKRIEKKVSFPYDPNKAMQAYIKQSINKTVKVDEGTMRFKSIQATPTMTVIKGKLNVDKSNPVSESLGGIGVIANGKKVEQLGRSTNSSMLGGQNFELRFDALPSPLESLEIDVKEFINRKKVNKEISLKDSLPQTVNIAGEDIMIKNVSTNSKGTSVKISSKEHTKLQNIFVGNKNDKTPIDDTFYQADEYQRGDGTVMKERTLFFYTTKAPEYLYIGEVYYMKSYNKKIRIPLD